MLPRCPWPQGRHRLPAPFNREFDNPVGEIWFEPPPQLDGLLIKYLFTSEKLSVQVHPRAGTGVPGKDECWLVLDAEPEARLAIGFLEPLESDAVRTAALDGTIEDLLEWHPAKRGDFFYLPAGTVHAIGPGLTLVEIQQNSDITYRLYDYGRPRELHLDQALAVAERGPYDGALRTDGVGAASRTLVDGPHFRLQHIVGKPTADQREALGGAVAILPLSGRTIVAGETISPGECGVASSLEQVDATGDSRFLTAAML